ncbi:MAG: metalloregulator ArsR/SmtB family transcription factor [Actinobacteria bacterium]|jgi:DNA-binding transcriptional ArsR family regulator|nr:metalloregulator ArsR/SmtB family transcription factor [Actinomycetota bacterium]
MVDTLLEQATVEATDQREGTGLALLPAAAEGKAIVAKFFRALGDPSRLALLQYIAEGERNGTDCVRYLHLSQSRVSSHLACLVECGYITVRRSGRFAYYKVSDPRVLQLVQLGTELASANAASVAACTRT